MRTLSGFFERVLGRASLGLFDRVRRWRRQELVRAFSARAGAAPRWYTLTEWLQRSPDNPRLMALIGPRWNCHAIIALTDFFPVHRSIALRAAEAEASAAYWTLVIYDARFQVVQQLGNTSSRGQPTPTLEAASLAPGRYLLALRYYESPECVVFPEIIVDGQPSIDAAPAGAEAERYQAYLTTLGQNRSLSELLLQFHAYALLKHRERYEATWLRSRYLPVGNPETGFVYGALEKGQVLRIVPSRTVCGETYVSIYDRASRPLLWQRVKEPLELASERAGTYLVRHVSRAGSFVPHDLEVSLQRQTR